MSFDSREESIKEIDKVLAEVRETLLIEDDAGDINELVVLQMLLQVTKELHNLNDVRQVITKVLDSAIAFAGGERAFIMLMENDTPRFKMGRDENGEYLTVEQFSPSQGVIQQVVETRKTIIVPDAQSDSELSKRVSVQSLSLRVIMCSPLIIKHELLGLLYVDSSQNPMMTFSPRGHLNFLTSLADQSAVAIRNAQKFETHT